LFSQTGNLCLERRLSLALDEIRARPIHEQQDARHRGGKHQKIEGGEAEGMCADQPLAVFE
jgi:hypothetical protein